MFLNLSAARRFLSFSCACAFGQKDLFLKKNGEGGLEWRITNPRNKVKHPVNIRLTLYSGHNHVGFFKIVASISKVLSYRFESLEAMKLDSLIPFVLL